jgi:hypothetical protein
MKPVRSALSSRAGAVLTSMALVVAFAQPPASAQQTPTIQYFQGVWRITKVVTPEGVADTSPQPGLSLFSGNYFSIARVTSSEARTPAPPPRNPERLTDAEKIARYEEWAPYGAAAGTFEITGDTLVTHNIVAKAVRGMGLTEQATVQLVDADTFVATAKPGEPNAGRQTTYTRVR